MAPDDILAGFKKDDGTFNPAALGPLAGVIGGQSLGDSMKGFANAALIGPGLRLLGVKGFADGGAIMAPGATKAVGASMATLGNNNNGSSPPLPRKDDKDILGGFKKEDGSFNPAALGPLVGILAGQSVGDSFKGFANSMMGPVPRLMGFKGFADGGVVGLRGGGDPGSFYRDFSDRREDNRVDYLNTIRERMRQRRSMVVLTILMRLLRHQSANWRIKIAGLILAATIFPDHLPTVSLTAPSAPVPHLPRWA